MGSRTQVLIPEGELDRVFKMVAKAGRNKMIGSLFGLWRHSLIQPVVHLAVCPGKKAKLSHDTFLFDESYKEKCKKYLENHHGLLQIGLWIAGEPSRYPKLDPRSHEFNTNNRLSPGRYAVLMFFKTDPSFSCEFLIVDKSRPSDITSDSLYQEDILPGKSSFRLLPELSNKICNGAMFKLKKKEASISRQDFPSLRSARPRLLGANRPHQQWYDNDDGQSLLRKLCGQFETYGYSVSMSRDTETHNMSISVNEKVTLRFPRNFPKENASWECDSISRTGNSDEFCYKFVEKVRDVFGALNR